MQFPDDAEDERDTREWQQRSRKGQAQAAAQPAAEDALAASRRASRAAARRLAPQTSKKLGSTGL
jgi:hypothetical protein